MATFSNIQAERSRNIQKQLREAVEDKGRDAVGRVLGISKGTTSKFCSGDHPDDCKINIETVSDLLSVLGFNLCSDDEIVVPRSILELGIAMANEAYGNGPVIQKWRELLEPPIADNEERLGKD